MKISTILTTVFLLLCSISRAQDLSRDFLLNHYNKYPLQALKQAEEMQSKALETNDRILFVKSLVLKTTYSQLLDPNSFSGLVQGLEAQLKQEKDTIAQSLLHSYIAQFYAQYYNNKRYIINQRSNPEGFTPENPEEWSSNLFKEKIFHHFEASVKPEILLKKVGESHYRDVFLSDSKTDSLFLNLYNFLCFRIVELLSDDYEAHELKILSLPKTILGPEKEFINISIPVIPLNTPSYKLNVWQKLLRNLSVSEQTDLTVMLDLKRLSYTKTLYSKPDKGMLLLNTLRDMRKKYYHLPVSVEIIAQEANLLAQDQYNAYPLLWKIDEQDPENLAKKQEALALCEEGIRLFPEYERINLLRQIIDDLQIPDLNISYPNTIYPDKELTFKISSKNIKSIVIEVVRIDSFMVSYNTRQSDEKIPGTQIFEQTCHLQGLLVHRDTTVVFPGLKAGLYKITAQIPGTDKKVSQNLLSTQFFISGQACQGTQTLRVCDRLSGKPIKNATVYIYNQDKDRYHLKDSLYTNAQGLASFKSKDCYYQVVNKENPQGYLNRIWEFGQMPNQSEHTEVITDRKIYRPGQMVYFKGISWISEPDSLFPQTNTEFTAKLRSADGKVIAQQTFTSNKFGTFAGSFQLPKHVLNGRFSISTWSGRTDFEVADYKRPEFEITFSAPKRTYYIGDTIYIQGKANSFSGVNISNNEVKYQITNPQSGYPMEVSESCIKGVTNTNSNGEFEFYFVANGSFEIPAFLNTISYRISATITDAKGETQNAQTNIRVFTKQATPTLKCPDKINKDVPTPIYISLDDRTPQDVPGKVLYSISKLVSPNEPLLYPYIFKDTIIEKTILQGELSMVQKDSITPILKNQMPGAYLLTVMCGNHKAKQIFSLYSSRDKRPPFSTYDWLVEEKTKCFPGEKARVLFGTSTDDSYVLYEFFTINKLIKREFVTLSNEVIPIEIPYLAEYGNRIRLIISYVKDGHFIQKNVPIDRLYENRSLTIETKVFRDKLIPGQKEQWELRITNARHIPRQAEVLAFMYDASLDKLAPNDIDFYPNYLYPYFRCGWGENNYRYTEGRLGFNSYSFLRSTLPFPRSFFDRVDLFTRTGIFSQESTGEDDYSLYETMVGSMSSKTVTLKGYNGPVKGRNTAEKGESNPEATLEYRQNFQETAFFYPQLVTDSAGCVFVNFTVPESTTKWKFVAIANTTDLVTAKLTAYAVTSKPLMVRPNLPRFLRSGDRAELKMTVSNLSDSLQTGNARLELFSPGDNRVIIKQDVPFKVAAGESRTLSYHFDVPRQMDVIGCRMSATSGSFSDGEQQLLPILPDEILVTATQPFYTGEKGEHSYTLKQNSPTRRDYRLTLEVTANPIWYAVMALPPLTEPQTNNATNIAAAYYVNTVAAMIARSNPQIENTIRAWQAGEDKSETLHSKLEQNPELKSILLSVTPWALQAQNETERMQMLATLFDPNRLSYLQEQALDKLSDLQSQDGGWCWFKGMYPGRFITMNILSTMAQANTTGQKEYGEREKRMQIKALRYLDNGIKKDYGDKPKSIRYEQILYLYTRSMYRDIPLGDALDAHKFFMAQAQKQWQNFSLYEKAVTAVTFYRYGFKEDARNVLRSLKEYSKTTPDMGMFWPTNQNVYYRNSAVQIQAAIMEAFHEIEGDSDRTDLMKQWLLRQKQTQMWESVPSTVDAIHALLLTGKNQLATQMPITVTIGENRITTPSDSNPLGYAKVGYSDAEIKPDMFTVKLEKTTDTPTWGSLYLQYFDKLDQIQKQKGALGVDKKLFIEQTSADGKKELKPLDKGEVKVGDKVIVRLTLSLTRDMEFLYLKDLRASCFEPVEQLSGNHWQFGTVYYQESKDACTNFFFTTLRQGTYVIEYPVWVNQAGEYQDGIATLESIYAPEYNAFSGSTKIKIKN